MPRSPSGVAIDGTRVRELRKLAGESLVAFAPKCGVSFQYLSQIETGARATVSPPAFARICDALGVQDRESMVKKRRRPPRQRRRPQEDSEPVRAVA